ncbi:MAG: hypothetical protein AAFY72_11820, partial [Cyanobacteria bacterium J06649_4]
MKNCVGRIRHWRYGLLMLVSCIVVTVYGQCASGAVLMHPVVHSRALVSLSSVDASVVEPSSVDARLSAMTDNSGTLETDFLENSPATVDDYLDSGQALYDAGQFQAAIAAWN